MHQPEETASNNFNAFLSFGLTGALQFDGVKGPLGVTLTGNELIVSAPGQKIADFRLAQPPEPYSVSEFSVKGNEVLFHFIPPPPIPVTLVP